MRTGIPHIRKTKLPALILGFCLLPILAMAQLLFPQEVQFEPKGGFYATSQEISLSHEEEGAIIFYTLDGSEPDKNTLRYTRPFYTDTTVVVRAVALKPNGTRSRIESSTYFIDEPETDFAVVSLAVPPKMLFDSIVGIFEEGVKNDLTGAGNYGANYWSRQEYFMNAEIFESNDSCVYRSPCGFRLFGGVSRQFPQKSLAIISRLRYGDKRFRHQLFPNTKEDKYKFLILRNAGSDWGKAHGRDAVITDMVDDWDILKQNHRPCHVYLNGKYWGVYYIREKINSYFVATHVEGVHPDTMDLIEHRKALRKGTLDSYNTLLKFLADVDMSKKENYEFLKGLMDVANYADYKLLQIFIDNQDAGGNIKFWRSDDFDGKWRWILYDTDWGFGLMRGDAFEFNSLDFHLEPEGPDWPNPPWSTFILRRLMENPEFEAFFVNRFCDRLNTTLRTDTMTAHIDRHQAKMASEMPRQWERWDHSERVWNIHYNRMRRFARKRPAVMRQHLEERFNTGKRVSLTANAEGRGSVWINENLKASYVKTVSGEYYENYPVTIQARPRLGWQFSHWEGSDDPSPNLTLNLKGRSSVSLKAIFIPLTTELEDKVHFNEISCFNHKTGDWLEIRNGSEERINLEGWIIKNRKKEYKLPAKWLAAGDYVVVAKDTSLFAQTFPVKARHIVGNFDFGLDKFTDKLELYTARGATVDTFTYNIQTPGRSFTIDLREPQLDNGNKDNWEVVFGQGTPLEHNPFYFAQLAREAHVKWTAIGVFIALLLVFGVWVFTRFKS